MSRKKTPIGDRIKKRRQELGWNQEYLAKITGISRIHLVRLENNTIKNPGIVTLKKISYSLAIGLEELCM